MSLSSWGGVGGVQSCAEESRELHNSRKATPPPHTRETGTHRHDFHVPVGTFTDVLLQERGSVSV